MSDRVTETWMMQQQQGNSNRLLREMPSASAALVLLFVAFSLSNAQPGFISLDCGGDDDYTDGIGIQWTSDAKFVSAGQKANLLLQNQQLQQYTTVRSFPADNRKYCYTMNVRNRTRYLVRATFLYGNFDNSNVYPKFDLSLGPTPWTTVVIDDATTPVVQEAIILAAAPTLSVCLSNASTGQPFISTLELRQFNGSLYYTTDEKQFFLRLSARINFGAESNASVSHLEDNQLTGALPPSLGELPNLKEFFSGNSDLRMGHSNTGRTIVIIVCAVVGAILILVAAIVCYLFTCKRKKKSSDETVVIAAPAKKLGSFFSEVATESAHRFALSEIEDATDKFDRRIGSGGFGIVYYGKLTDGREIAVKLLTNDSYQGIREFLNEVTLLSRIHHRNLVSFLGYSQQDGKNILVYEFMHNGTLKEHLRGGPDDVKITSWVKRLEIAEDAAKGIEYLHTGCSPTIIHRDLKSSNILLDKNMRAKVADFGLSKPVVDGSHVSSIVRGTVGYLDPDFGVILLELISGHEPISNDNFGLHCRNIVEWARSHMESGDIHGIIDQSLDAGYDLQSVWKIAEVATMCVKPKGVLRPSISEVLKEIQDAIAIELQRELPSSIHHLMSKTSPSEAVNTTGSLQDLEQNASFDELLMRPGLR
uniref:Protein kinase domain-containing protein n=1 Tax=Oryza rufipogon TaxID=4529 RepID=A0A0E0RCJ2_ORYRU